VSVLLAVPLLALLEAITVALWDLPHFATASATFDAAVFLTAITLPLCLIGWLLALPLVWNITDFSRWRFLAFWAIGTALGPLAIFGMFLVGLLADPQPLHSFSLPSAMVGFATAIACLTTLFYLLLVRLHPAQNTPSLHPAPQAS
jgi:hypothetical protein